MDQITQLDGNLPPVTPVAHSINLKLWGGLFGLVLVVAVGAIIFTGKTTLYKGSIVNDATTCNANGGTWSAYENASGGTCEMPQVLTTISPSVNVTVPMGGRQQFTAKDQDGNDITSGITWEVSHSGTITPAGLFTPTSTGEGLIITASSGDYTTNVTVTVNSLPDLIVSEHSSPLNFTTGDPIHITMNVQNIGNYSAVVSKALIQLHKHDTASWTATDSPSLLWDVEPLNANTTSGVITWSPTIPPDWNGTYDVNFCADFVNGNSSGLITESNENNNCFVDTLTINPASVLPTTTMTITSGTTSLTVNGTTQFIVNDPLPTTFSWSSSDTNVGTINASGLFTAIAPGNTDIRVTSEGTASAPTTVTVTELTTPDDAGAPAGAPAAPAETTSCTTDDAIEAATNISDEFCQLRQKICVNHTWTCVNNCGQFGANEQQCGLSSACEFAPTPGIPTDPSRCITRRLCSEITQKADCGVAPRTDCGWVSVNPTSICRDNALIDPWKPLIDLCNERKTPSIPPGMESSLTFTEGSPPSFSCSYNEGRYTTTALLQQAYNEKDLEKTCTDWQWAFMGPGGPAAAGPATLWDGHSVPKTCTFQGIEYGHTQVEELKGILNCTKKDSTQLEFKWDPDHKTCVNLQAVEQAKRDAKRDQDQATLIQNLQAGNASQINYLQSQLNIANLNNNSAETAKLTAQLAALTEQIKKQQTAATTTVAATSTTPAGTSTVVTGSSTPPAPANTGGGSAVVTATPPQGSDKTAQAKAKKPAKTTTGKVASAETSESAESISAGANAKKSAAPVTATPPPGITADQAVKGTASGTISGYAAQNGSATAGATAGATGKGQTANAGTGATQMRGAYVSGTVIPGKSGPEMLLYLGVLPIAWGLRRIRRK